MIITKRLLITQAKPNPIGKDRMRGFTPQTQLVGEWVDFRNSGGEPFSLDNIQLDHVAYTSSYPNGVWEKVMGFSGILPAGEVVRVHSGGQVPLTSIPPIDLQGADYHLFTGENFIWNNNRSDTPRLRNIAINTVIDQASYSANVLEGKILRRNGDSLL